MFIPQSFSYKSFHSFVSLIFHIYDNLTKLTTCFSLYKSFMVNSACWVIFQIHDFCQLTIFNINFFIQFFQEQYQNVKLFGSRSGLTFCQA